VAQLAVPFAAMGCPCEFKLEGDADALRAAAAAARAEVDRLELKYSHYRDDSLIAQFGACADTGQSCEVDEETANLLDFAAALTEQSDGRFDLTAGVLTKLWDLRDDRLPSAAAIAAARARCGWRDLVRWERPRLAFARSGVRLDLGGLVKEYAADRAAQVFREHGVRHGVVDLGGDLALIGAHADGTPWRAGIKAPRTPQEAFATIELTRGGLATSGDYERSRVVDGRRYTHIVDVRNGEPVQSFASVSVLADTCLIAGAAATLAILFGEREGDAWLQQLGLPYVAVNAQGRVSGTLANT